MNNLTNNELPITLLRVEGVNLAHSIGDTEQLSTRRGGGLLLLEAVRDIAILCTHSLKPISTGASVGLFEVKDSYDADKVAQDVRNYLAGHPLFKHATFIVAISDGKSDFPVAKEQVVAGIRWQQMQSLSFSTQGLQPGKLNVCRFDEVRPVCKDITVKRGDPEEVIKVAVSASVAERHDYGRRKKQSRANNKNEYGEPPGYEAEFAKAQKLLGVTDPDLLDALCVQYFSGFFEAELTEAKNLPDPPNFDDKLLEALYVQHFEDLTRPLPDYARDNKDAVEKDVPTSGLPEHVEPAVLEGKMAVFYADGNKFGRIDRGAKTPAALQKWDAYIKGERRKLLVKIVQRASHHYHWKTPPAKNKPHQNRRKIRLEVLLWGGDELIFVLPGWCAMEFAQLFFKATEGMKYEIERGKGEEPLTHACGMVFCHHQAPISGITRLAKKLADKVKRSSDPQVNALNWMVLESFDHAQYDLDELMSTRYPHNTPDWDAIALTDKAVTALHDRLPGLKETLPRSAMMRALRIMVTGGTDAEASSRLQACYASVNKAISGMADEGAAFDTLWQTLHPQTRRWKPPPKVGNTAVAATPSADDTPSVNDPRVSDLAAWIKLLELWDYCPGLYPPDATIAPNNQGE